MDFNHGLIGRSCEDHKAIGAVNELVDPEKVNRPHGVHGKQVFGLFPVVIAPLIKAVGREDHPPISETVGKGFLLCRRFRASVDNQLVILVARKAKARRGSDELTLPINDRRDNIAGENLAGLILSRIVLLLPIKSLLLPRKTCLTVRHISISLFFYHPIENAFTDGR